MEKSKKRSLVSGLAALALVLLLLYIVFRDKLPEIISALSEVSVPGVCLLLAMGLGYQLIDSAMCMTLLRSRLPGDRFRPAGRGVSKELRKWMNEAGVPARLRDTLPLLADGSNVLWVCGAGFAEGLAPDAESKWLLQLETDVELWEEQCHEHAR